MKFEKEWREEEKNIKKKKNNKVGLQNDLHKFNCIKCINTSRHSILLSIAIKLVDNFNFINKIK